jgi:putative membrane protein
MSPVSELIAYFHFLGVVALFATLFAEILLFRPDLPLPGQRRLVIVDIAYGVAATLVLVTGLLRVYGPGVAPAQYFKNPAFHLMGAAFLVAALLSFYPTRKFLVRLRRMRGGDATMMTVVTAGRIERILYAELGLLLIALWFAVLMARGIGYDWLT